MGNETRNIIFQQQNKKNRGKTLNKTNRKKQKNTRNTENYKKYRNKKMSVRPGFEEILGNAETGLLKCHETTIREQKQGLGAGLALLIAHPPIVFLTGDT